ncbi:hypothetical protein BO71DRAFT_448542 [Aspergillus ellipticus CBS 707.79]|uniref:Stress-response A/B barrel domain-containing protein n=1 Tax=Aspergillus ellipticus CBS 707.79 TaxID=1448320 RepID=A0A319DRG7_9EURO|nr:hypothetical protein BO71DRAFT_448542 [Aspergillus ellipticus CBS 707.79]
MPITHLVLFQFKSDVNPDTVNGACARMLALKDTCLHPASRQPYIRASSGGVDNSIEGIQFPTVGDRDYYVREDPAHQAFIRSLDGLIEKAQVQTLFPRAKAG